MSSAYEALAAWYAAHSAIRRLWAFQESQRIRVLVTIAPTHDGDEIYPAWLANSEAWRRDLQVRLEEQVHLDLLAQALRVEPSDRAGGALVAELSWRDDDGSPVLG